MTLSRIPANSTVVTRDLEAITEKTGNVYESIAIISKRARQISAKVKEELNSKLAEFATTVDNLEEIFENRAPYPLPEVTRYQR